MRIELLGEHDRERCGIEHDTIPAITTVASPLAEQTVLALIILIRRMATECRNKRLCKCKRVCIFEAYLIETIDQIRGCSSGGILDSAGVLQGTPQSPVKI